MKDEIALTESRAKELEMGTSAAIEDMKQQITDLEFYLRTQQKIEGLELKDEIQDSSLVILNGKEEKTPSNSKRNHRRGRKS